MDKMLLLGAYLSCLLVNVAPRPKIEIFFGAECRIMWTGMRRGACVGDLGLIQILRGTLYLTYITNDLTIDHNELVNLITKDLTSSQSSKQC